MYGTGIELMEFYIPSWFIAFMQLKLSFVGIVGITAIIGCFAWKWLELDAKKPSVSTPTSRQTANTIGK